MSEKYSRSKVANSRKKKRKKVRPFRLISLFVLAVLGLLFYYSQIDKPHAAISEKKLDISVATASSMEGSITLPGVLVRNEFLFSAPVTGVVNLRVLPGEKIRMGTVIAEVIEESIKKKFDERNSELEEKAEMLEKSTKDEIDSLDKRISEVAKQIDATTDQLKKSLLSYNSEEIRICQQNLKQLAGERHEKIALLESLKVKLEKDKDILLGQKKAVDAMLAGAKEKVLSSNPGIVMYTTDSLEKAVNCSQPENIRKFLDGSLDIQIKEQTLKNGDQVEKGQLLFKVVDSFSVRLYVLFSDQQFKLVNSLEKIEIRFKDRNNQVLPAKISWVEQKSSKQSKLVALQFDNNPIFNNIRKTTIQIITKSNNGIIVPKDIIVKKSKKLGVYTLDDNKVKFVPVIVRDLMDTRALIDGVARGTKLINNPADVKDGLAVSN